MATHTEKIGVLTATIVGMNAMIGAGILAIPSAFATHVGPAGIISFFLVALAVWFMAQSIARVAQAYPQEGSFYTYAAAWGGHSVGIIAGASYLIGLCIAMGLLTYGAGNHLTLLFPCFSAHTWSVTTLITIVLLNIIGVSISALGQQILIILTIFPLLATIALCIPSCSISHLTPFAPFGIKSIFSQMRIGAFCFFGFEACASLFTIIKEPAKNLPRAITYGLFAVTLLYLVFVAVLMLSVPLYLFQQFPGTVVEPLTQMFPQATWINTAILIASISAIVGTLHSMIWSSGALLISFTKKLHNPITQKLLAFNMLNNRTTYGIIGFLIFTNFILLKGNNTFFNLTALFLLTSYTLSMIALLKIPAEWRSKQNYITLVGIASACLIAYFALENALSYVKHV